MKPKALCLILTLLMLAPSVMSCSDNGSDNDKTNTANTGNAASSESGETEAETEPDLSKLIYDSLPKGDYGGQTFSILVPTHQLPTFKTELTGDVVNDAVFERNTTVEEKLNISLNVVDTPGLWDDRDAYMNTVRNSVLASDDAYQLIAGYAAYITSLTADGVFTNWNDVPDIDFTQTWWNSDIVEEMNINDRLYFVTGDLSVSLLDYLYCMFFNKQLYKDFGLEDPYEIVNEGRWTLDTMNSYIANSIDVNGDGKMDGNDLYGYISDFTNSVSAYVASFDEKITVKDASGVPILANDSETYVDKFNALYSTLRENPHVMLYAEADNAIRLSAFKEGRAILMGEMLGESAKLRDSETEFGIIPYPKYDEQQTDYYTTAWDGYMLFSVPKTADVKTAGPIIENLAAHSFTIVTPAFYEKALKGKYARDNESSAMIDIIRNGATFNFGTVNSIHCGSCGHTYRSLVEGSNPNIASELKGKRKVMEKSLEKFVKSSYYDE